MVRGTLCKLKFPYAHFGTSGITAYLMFPILDEALYRLESRGIKVISITADGVVRTENCLTYVQQGLQYRTKPLIPTLTMVKGHISSLLTRLT